MCPVTQPPPSSGAWARIMSFLNPPAPHPPLQPLDSRVTTPHLRSARRFPELTLPLVSKWKDMVGTAFSLAIVGYVINLAMGRTLAAKHGYDVDPNQVLLGLGRPRTAPFALRHEGKSSRREREAFRRARLKADVLLPWRLRGFVPCGGQKDTEEPCPVGCREAGKGKGALGWALCLAPPPDSVFWQLAEAQRGTCTSQGAEKDLDSWCVTQIL